MCGDMHATVLLWGSKNNLLELVLSFYHVDLRNQTQVITLGANVFTLMSHLTSFNIFHYVAPNIILVALSTELLTKVTKY